MVISFLLAYLIPVCTGMMRVNSKSRPSVEGRNLLDVSGVSATGIRRQISECWKGLREREPTLVHADESVASARYDVVQKFDAQQFAR